MGKQQNVHQSEVSNRFIDLSVVIITLNEAHIIDHCLRSLPVGCEIIVLDSGSHDQTCEIAQKWGARVYQRPFDFYAAQKNAAISYATRSWVLSLDADEILSPQLSHSLVKQLKDIEGHVAFRLKRRLVFMGRIMGFGKTCDYPLRLFRRQEANFIGSIHEALKPAAGVQQMYWKSGEILHYSYDNLDDYLEKFNYYTRKLADQKQEQGLSSFNCLLFIAVCLRPFTEFLSRYLLRLGFLDGFAGFTYALLSSMYAFVKYAKVYESVTRPRHESLLNSERK